MPRVKFIADAEIRTLPDDNGPIPRQVRSFRAGETALLPAHQYERAIAKGVAIDDAPEPGSAVEAAGGDTGRTTQGRTGGAAKER